MGQENSEIQERQERVGLELETGTHAYFIPQKHKEDSGKHFMDDSGPATVENMVTTLNETLGQIAEQGGKVITVLPLSQDKGNAIVSRVGIFSWIFIVEKT